MQGGLFPVAVSDGYSGMVWRDVQLALIFITLRIVTPCDFLLNVAQGALLAVDEELRELTPLGFRHLITRLVSGHIINFISHIHD